MLLGGGIDIGSLYFSPINRLNDFQGYIVFETAKINHIKSTVVYGDGSYDTWGYTNTLPSSQNPFPGSGLSNTVSMVNADFDVDFSYTYIVGCKYYYNESGNPTLYQVELT